MQPVAPAPRDPAPSRLRYRMQRWMLTPGIRTALRIGIPLMIVVGATGGLLSDQGRRDAMMLKISELRASIEERPEFMVGLMAIDGASPGLSDDIREAVPLDFPVSSFDLKLEQIRMDIAELDPVKSASVRIRPGGVLQVDVIARKPAIIWRTRDGIELLDRTGAHIDVIASRLERPELAVIAGDGADAVVPEALALIQAAAPLGDRLRGLVRVGERRWDVVLDRNQRILLPPDRPVRALERVIALSEAQDMLERDVAVVDLRLAARPTLRMTSDAVENWWRIREINGSGQ
ncbi:cell division protein FtsQ/DivIB [Sedimentitalea todarodis]|uniref:Cell division protein FtsQ n=1 Tax=Sedimentitalea todarodis TaxID=1631240 RepID=A0ABU3V8S3_9RHOB|nr:cell division protein FtsQ/DivIB [Sedimentitalea todarodis]MDU9002567.1 cell division protein FtsQ/DivIB [Sedimentitalea todarodis]